MIHIHQFVFGPFQENTYILWDNTHECILIDPGNTNLQEDTLLSEFIHNHQLTPKRVLLTHGHLDHIAGNDSIFSKYQLLPEVHPDDLFLIHAHALTAQMYGIPCHPSPLPKNFIQDKNIIRFGHSELHCIHTPGHSPGSITFYSPSQKFIISGDVLFHESIGRTDLPKGNYDTLKESIQKKLYTLPDDTIVYPGHGPTTTIAHEKKFNMFVTA